MIQCMKHLKLATICLVGLTLCALVANADQYDLDVTCGDQHSTVHPSGDSRCREGMVTFRGTNYPENVYIKVLSYPAGNLIDSAVYGTVDGQLTFTQTLVPAGGYSVIVSQNGNQEVLETLILSVDSLR